MKTSCMTLAVAALALSATLAAAQTQDKANNVGTAAATSQSKKYTIPGGGAAELRLLRHRPCALACWDPDANRGALPLRWRPAP